MEKWGNATGNAKIWQKLQLLHPQLENPATEKKSNMMAIEKIKSNSYYSEVDSQVKLFFLGGVGWNWAHLQKMQRCPDALDPNLNQNSEETLNNPIFVFLDLASWFVIYFY